MSNANTLVPEDTYVGLNGKEYKIHPMKIGDYAQVERLFSKIDDQFLYFNMPTIEVDDNGKPIKKENGKYKYNYDRFNAMCELFEMALGIKHSEVLEALDVNTGVFVLDAYRGLSGLKKKIQEAQATALLTSLSQVSSKTQAKPENQ